jgi:ELWxxDGT repeat protein
VGRRSVRVRQRSACAELVRLESRKLLTATLLGDINTQPAFDANPSEAITVNNVAYFFKTDVEHGSELWRSDGTDGGTWLVKDIDPGIGQGGGAGIAPYFAATPDGTIYFSATGTVGDTELWKSDGTDGGTVEVKDIHPGPNGSTPTYITATPSGVFFLADDGTSGRELWFSNGTDAGTYLVKDLRPGSAGQNPRGMVYLNGSIYFGATDGSGSGQGLWKSTGAVGNFTQVKSNSFLSVTTQFTAFDNRLYMADITGVLWTSDGTTGGTVVVQNNTQTAAQFLSTGQALYLRRTNSSGDSIYRIDPGSTVPTSVTSTVLSISNLAAIGQDLYYAQYNDGLYRVTKGSAPSKVLNLGASAANSSPGNLKTAGSNLYFSTGNSTAGYTLWTQQGAGGTPYSVVKLNDGRQLPNTFTAVGGRLLFINGDAATRNEFWTSDGTPGGTQLLRDIDTATSDASPFFYAQLGQAVLLRADDGVHGSELWSAGFDGSLTMLADITPGTSPQGPFGLVTIGNVAYFTSGSVSPAGSEPWITDGTPGGTYLLKDIRSGTSSSNPSGYTLYKDRVYFSADNGVNGAEVWSTDGTANGTTLFADLYAGATASNPSNFIVFNDALYFTAADATHGTELWVTDGTAAGTRIIKDVYPNSSSSNPANLTVFGNALYFTATDGSTGVELWKTDGTSLGTARLKDIRAGFSDSSPAGFTQAGRYLYFTANDGVNGLELWRTDGTPGGTSLFFDLLPGSASSASGLQAAVDDRIFWMAKDASGGLQLWRAGGRTDAPPALVKQLYVGGTPVGSYGALTAVRGRLFWAGYDGSTPSELWCSDGTPEGTVPVDDQLRAAILVRRLLPTSNGNIYFGGATVAFGEEPCVAPDTFAPTVADAWFDTSTGRTVHMRLSEDINPSTTAQVRLTNRTTGEELRSDAFVVEYDPGTHTLSITLNAAADGEYRLALLPSDLADLSGNLLVTGSIFDFFILGGDVNHDRSVDFLDLARLAQNYNTTGKTFADGDFNYDGNVDFLDLALLAQRYNTTLAAPAAPVMAAPVTAPVKKKTVVPNLPPAPLKKAAVVKKPGRSPFAVARLQ